MKFANQNWKKIALFTAPVLVAGSVYAFAANGDSSSPQAASAATATSQGGVTATVSAAQPLSAQEMAELTNAKPAPATAANQPDGSIPQSVLDANNPFSVAAATPASGSATTGSTPAAPQPATSPNASFDIAQVKNMQLNSNTTEGQLKVQFKTEGGTLKLEGTIGDRKIQIEGDQARELLGRLVGGLNLKDALTASLQGKQVQLDSKVLGALQDLQVEMNDGRKIQANGHNPKAQGQHDNGQHKGLEKQQQNHDDNKEKSKGKGHDKHGDD
jgi:hypothetical protein